MARQTLFRRSHGNWERKYSNQCFVVVCFVFLFVCRRERERETGPNSSSARWGKGVLTTVAGWGRGWKIANQ